MIAASLEIEILTNLARLTKDMDEVKSKVGSAMNTIERAAGAAKAALVGLGAAGLALAFAGSVRAAIDLADKLDDLSQKSGVAVEQLSQLQYAARLGGSDAEGMTTAIKKLNLSIAAGISGDKEKLAMFKALGITLKDTAGHTKSADVVLLEMADTFAKHQDGATKSAAAVALLGKTGDDIIPLLNGGSKSIRELMTEADKLGLTISSDFAQQAAEFNDSLDRIQAAGSKSAILFAGDFVKGIGLAMKAMADATIEGGRLAGVVAGLQTLLTGDDRYKNDKAMVEQTEEKMRLEKSLARMEAQRGSGRVVNEAVIDRQREALSKVNEQLKITQSYRKVLQDQDDAAAASAKRASDERDKAGQIRLANTHAKTDATKQFAEQDKLILEQAGLSGSFTKDWNDLTAIYLRTGQSVKWLTEQQAILLAKQPAIKKAAEDRTKAMLAELDATQALAAEMDAAAVADSKSRELGRQAVNDYAQAVEDSNALLRLEQSLYGASSQQRAAALAQYQIELDLKKQIAAIDGNGAFDEAQREELRMQARTAAARAGAAAIERAGLEENIRILESVDNTAHDVFTNVFEAGDNAFKRIGQTLKAAVLDLLYQMTVKKWVINVVASASGAGAATQALAGTGTGGGGILGTLSNLSSLKNIGSLIGNGVMQTIADLLPASMSSALGMTSSSLMASNIALLGGGSSATAAATAAAAAGNATALGGIGSALGAIPGWGWAAMAAVAVASIFGGKGPKETVSSGIEGNIGAGGFAGNRFSNWKQDGGMFSSDGDGRDISGLDSGTAQQLSAAYAAVQTSARGMAAMLGLSADAIATYSQNISVILTGDAAKDQEIITKLFEDIGNRLALAVAPGLAAYAKEGEGATTTMDRLATSLQAANALLGTLGQRVFALSLAGADAASRLADTFGGLEQMSSAIGQYYDLFYSDAEKLANTQAAMAQTLASVGLQVPASKEAFRLLAESLDLNTDAGRTAYATLVSIAPQFATTADAMAKSAESAAARLLAGFTRNAVLDLDALGRALQDADIGEFSAAVTQVFDDLADRIKSVVDGIASERGAIEQARDQILNPGNMSRAEIQRSIASINTNGPGTAALVAAQRILAAADGQVAALSAAAKATQTLTGDRSGVDAAASRVGVTASAVAAAQSLVERFQTDWGGKFAEWVNRGLAGDFDNGLPNPSGERYAQNAARQLRAAQAEQAAAQAEYARVLAVYNASLAVLQAPLADQQAALAVATQAQADAANAARAAQLVYIASLQDFAIDAGKSVSKLGKLREQTLAYYEAQKQLADLMTTSAADLREAVRVARYGQLDSRQSLAQRQADFAQAYSMALATEGATKAGYADKLAAALPDLSTALADTASTRAEWALATARLFAQSQAIADQLDATAPLDYQAETLQLLESIDATLAALDDSAVSAERVIANAVNASAERTSAGLRAVIAAITGQSIPAFASGGYHVGGVRLVGENGPEWEATGQSRIYNASQMRAVMGGGADDDVAEELRDVNSALRAIAISTGATARTLKTLTPGGTALVTTTGT